MTVAVRAGTPLRELAEELAPHGQHVAFDAARVAEGATVGGLFATADSGPGALVHGSLRDLVIGVTMVLADGTVARSGGHVIKNVAGYDLAKLLHGSYGTLGRAGRGGAAAAPGAEGQHDAGRGLPAGRGRRAGRRGAGWPATSPPRWSGSRRRAGDGTLLIRLDGTLDALPARTEAPRGTPCPRPVALAANGTSPPAALPEGAVGARSPKRSRGSGRSGPDGSGRRETPGRGTRRSPGGARRRAPCCGSGCGRAGWPGCWPRCRPPR